MIIVSPTVPHSGTHFVGELVKPAVEAGLVERHALQHPYIGAEQGLINLIRDGNPMVLPRRRRDQVLESWLRYGKDPENFGQRSLEQWFEVVEDIARCARHYNRFYPIDIDLPGMRDAQLTAVNRYLGLELETDWQPVRQADWREHHQRYNESLAEKMACDRVDAAARGIEILRDSGA